MARASSYPECMAEVLTQSGESTAQLRGGRREVIGDV
jgi:hypothetical protein